MSTEDIKIKYYIQTGEGFVSRAHFFTLRKDEWDRLSDQEKHQLVHNEVCGGRIFIDWKVVE